MDVRKIGRLYANSVRVFKAFCDENRLRILDLLRSGEKCACRLLEDLHIGQSTLSHHMKILCESGVVDSRIEGKWTYYSINTDGIQYAQGLLEELAKVEEIADQCDNGEAQ